MLRFAPRYGIVSPCLVRPSRRRVRLRAANENRAEVTAADETLAAALRLFAAHGMAAAARACQKAEAAEDRGDAGGVEWWMAVCRTLDRRMAHDYSMRRRRSSSNGC